MALALMTACNTGNIQKAALAVQDYATALTAAQQLEISLYDQKLVTPAEHIQIQTYFKQAAQAGIELSAGVKALNKGGTVLALNQALTSTQTLLNQGVIPIKNPQAKAQVTLAVTTARTALSVVAAVLQVYTTP
jgi:hypothetical protein